MKIVGLSKKSWRIEGSLFAAVASFVACLTLFESWSLGVCLALVAASSVSQLLRSRELASEHSNSRLVPALAESLANGFEAGLSLVECFEELSRNSNKKLATKAQEMSAILDSNSNTSSKLARCAELISCREADLLFQLLDAAAVFGDRRLKQTLLGFARRTRDLHALEDELSSRLSWIKGTATLARFAPWVVVVFLSMRPEAAAAFNTTAGAGVLLAGLISSELARRLINAAAGRSMVQRPFRFGHSQAGSVPA